MKFDNIFDDKNRNLMIKLVTSYRYMAKSIGKEFAPLGLTPEQDTLLHVIDAKGEMNLSDVTQLLVREPTTVTQFVNRLEKKGFVTKKRASKGRNIVLSLTEQGKEIWEKDIALKVVNKTFENISEEEKVQLEKILDKMLNNSLHLLNGYYDSPFID